MGCTESLTRIFVFIVNFAFLLVGVALVIIGILNTVNYTKITDTIPEEYEAIKYVSVVAIVIGSIILVIAFLGCCGALKSSTCMLTTYGAILFVIFLIQVALGIYALITIKDNNDLESKISSSFRRVFSDCIGGSQERCNTIYSIQASFQCCGIDSATDWGNTKSNCESSYTNGCLSVLNDWISRSVQYIGIVAIAVSAVEVIGATLALCLSNCIRGRQRQTGYY